MAPTRLITESGGQHARRLLIEAAWNYCRPLRVAGSLARRRLDGEPETLALSWQAQRPLPPASHCTCSSPGSRSSVAATTPLTCTSEATS